MAEGIVEKVLVPTPRSKGIPCLRLIPLNERNRAAAERTELNLSNTVDEEEEDILFVEGELRFSLGCGALRFNLVSYRSCASRTSAIK